MDDAVMFGRRLRHARTDRGVSQAGLASGICSTSAVSRWEGGQSVPPADIIVDLAERLGLGVSVLTGRGFDSRLAESPDGFDALVTVAFGSSPCDATSPMSAWISRARLALDTADPWTEGDPRPVVDDLQVDPLTATTPATLEIVELLDALAHVAADPTARTVDTLVATLTWTQDAPGIFRRTAMETVVAVLLLAEMPIAARGAVARVSPASITETTRLLLTWDDGGSAEDGTPLPAVHARRTARDVAFSVLHRSMNAGRPDPGIVDAVVASCPGDGLVAEWVEARSAPDGR
ncbi:MAG: helix-turn-helix domain-containing protein [Corynebacterium sp.]